MIPRTRPNFDASTVLASLRHGRRQAGKCKAVANAIAHRTGVEHVTLAPSGRGALFLLLQCLPTGRVCIPGYTCSAVAEAASLAGREIAFLEHKAGKVNLTADDIAGQLLDGDIFILTHQYGYAEDIPRIVNCAEEQGAIVIEDIAAAFAGTCDGRPLGSFGHAAFGSFDVSKLVHVPLKGGFVATGDAELAARIAACSTSVYKDMSLMRMAELALKGWLLCLLTTPAAYRLFHALNFAMRGRTTAEDGAVAKMPNAFYRDRFGEWQAAIALPQLQDLDEIVRTRARIHRKLLEHCKGHPLFDVEEASPEVPGSSVRVPIYARENKLSLYRRLGREGVDCGFSFTSLATPRTQSSAWGIADCVLNLPYYPAMTERELGKMIQALDRISRNHHHAG